MGKQIVGHLYNGQLLCNKERWAADKSNIMVKSLMHYIEWKKPDSKSYKLYDSVYVTFWKKADLKGQRID